MLATGSVALPIPGVDFADRVVDTWGAWSLDRCPKSLVIVGAGASGSEIASAYGRLGAEVILIEMLDQILPAEDKDMARVVERAFKKDGMEVLTGTKVENVEEQKSVKVKAGDQEIKVDYLVIAGGRRPDTEALNLDAAGVKTDERGKIKVDDFQRTSTGRRLRDRRPRPRPRRSPTRPRRRASSPSRPPPAARPTRSTSTWSPARPSATRRWRASG